MSDFPLPTYDQLGPDPEPPGDRPRILIAGAGVGGLETALALRAYAGEHIRIDLLAPERHFTYRPLSVGEPFGRAATVQADLREIAEDRGFGLIRDALQTVDAAAHQVTTQDGRVLDYHALVLSLGARPAIAVPGALTFRGPRDVSRLRSELEALTHYEFPTVTFIAGNSATWTLPLYELALLTEHWARERDFRVHVRIVTAEFRPLAAFGREASEEVATLLDERGIHLHTDTLAGHVENGRLWVPIEGAIPADLAIALPYLSGPNVIGVPANSLGFVPVDPFCRVVGHDDVYAIGDMTQQPVKQGGLAAQMGDAAAAAIVAGLGFPVQAEPFDPVLRALLFTGERPLYLRNDGSEGPWQPAHKIVGTHLSPYLATHAELLVPFAAAA